MKELLFSAEISLFTFSVTAQDKLQIPNIIDLWNIEEEI
jgi:hypothetical protein